MGDQEVCNPLCPPFVIYVVLSALAIVLSLFDRSKTIRYRVIQAVVSGAWVALWGYLMYYLCKRCDRTAAWIVLAILVGLPLIGLLVLALILGLKM